jgi:hypothetical protein
LPKTEKQIWKQNALRDYYDIITDLWPWRLFLSKKATAPIITKAIATAITYKIRDRSSGGGAVGVGSGEGEGEGLGEGLGEGVGVGSGLSVGEGDGEGLGDGLGDWRLIVSE